MTKKTEILEEIEAKEAILEDEKADVVAVEAVVLEPVAIRGDREDKLVEMLSKVDSSHLEKTAIKAVISGLVL